MLNYDPYHRCTWWDVSITGKMDITLVIQLLKLLKEHAKYSYLGANNEIVRPFLYTRCYQNKNE